MASRRTRIKGIANIPQRRRTGNPEETSPIEDSNLNQEREVSADSRNEEKNRGDSKLLLALTTPNSLVETEKPTNGFEGSPSLLPEVVKSPTENKDLKQAPVRRKFIKPTVSVNAINRRPKEIEEVKSPVATANLKNNKIVILNEIISYPNQSKDILINNHKPETQGSDAQNNLLKPPDVYNGRSPGIPEREPRRFVSSSPQLLSPDAEYPIPPPSPNKINRSRIKAVPRLGQRNTSFSASESEDESRRNYRHRNDSVSSATSGLQDTNSIPECFSPQKPREYNSVIQRKCRRTEQSRKLAEARRDFYLKFGNNKPDRQKLTMMDLIFYNPVTNPMSGDKNKRKNSEVESEVEAQKAEEVDDPVKTGSDEENEVPAPQIKIGPQGEIVVDEQSLVIENKAVKKNREEIEKSKIVNADSETVYGVYKRAKRSKDWSKAETLKFYKALNTIGTDFTLMCELFPRRSRRELKMKFKKEERVNKVLVDKAIMQPCGFDFNVFKHEVDMEEKELQEVEKQKEREKIMKQEAKKRKAALPAKEPPEKQVKVDKTVKKRKKSLDIMNVLDDSDADESEVESVEDENPDAMLQTIQKPTRSGRVPKILDRYKASEDKPKPEPGSLVVVTSTDPNGQPVYKFCMVTGDNGTQQIGTDTNSLTEALEYKENRLTSLFTLSATPAEVGTLENNRTIPEENNVTIPAEDVAVPPEDNVTVAAEE